LSDSEGKLAVGFAVAEFATAPAVRAPELLAALPAAGATMRGAFPDGTGDAVLRTDDAGNDNPEFGSTIISAGPFPATGSERAVAAVVEEFGCPRAEVIAIEDTGSPAETVSGIALASRVSAEGTLSPA